MKKILLSLTPLLLSGCANMEAYQSYTESFDKAAENYYVAALSPLLDITLPAPEGEEYHIVVNREVEPMNPSQIKDSEWAPVVGKTVGVIGVVGTAAIVTNGVADIVDSVASSSRGSITVGDGSTLEGVGNSTVAGKNALSSGDDLTMNGDIDNDVTQTQVGSTTGPNASSSPFSDTTTDYKVEEVSGEGSE
jgi:hypothetical protein